MLCLTLKEGDYVMVGKDIKISFVKNISSDTIHIGINAPKSMEILRDKVYEKNLANDAIDSSKSQEEILASQTILAQNKKLRSKLKADKYRRQAQVLHDEERRLEKKAANLNKENLNSNLAK